METVLTITVGVFLIVLISVMELLSNLDRLEDSDDYLWGIFPEDNHYIDYEI